VLSLRHREHLVNRLDQSESWVAKALLIEFSWAGLGLKTIRSGRKPENVMTVTYRFPSAVEACMGTPASNNYTLEKVHRIADSLIRGTLRRSQHQQSGCPSAPLTVRGSVDLIALQNRDRKGAGLLSGLENYGELNSRLFQILHGDRAAEQRDNALRHRRPQP
jgi:hypothetical protein